MATELGQFDNPVSGTIIGAIVGMTLIGFILLLFGSGYGILFTVLGVILYLVGDTDLPDTPLTGGVLYFWGRPLKWKGKAMVVGGRSISFDIPLVRFKLLPVVMASKTFEFKYEATSEGGVTIPAKITIVARVDRDDLIDLIQVGGSLEAAFDLIKGVLGVSLQILTDGKTIEQLTEKGAFVKRLGDRMIKIIETGSFGVKVDKLSIDFDQPDDVKKAALARTIELHQRKGEKADLITAIDLARQIQVAVTQNPGLEPHIDRVLGMFRASRAGNVQGIAGGGGGGGRRGRGQRGGNIPAVAVINPTTKP